MNICLWSELYAFYNPFQIELLQSFTIWAENPRFWTVITLVIKCGYLAHWVTNKSDDGISRLIRTLLIVFRKGLSWVWLDFFHFICLTESAIFGYNNDFIRTQCVFSRILSNLQTNCAFYWLEQFAGSLELSTSYSFFSFLRTWFQSKCKQVASADRPNKVYQSTTTRAFQHLTLQHSWIWIREPWTFRDWILISSSLVVW